MTVIPANADRTLGDLVAERPQVARVLDRLGLDYCCHGDRTVGQACAVAGLDADAVLAELTAVQPDTDIDTTWTTLDAVALADHIESTHHAYLHTELPELDALATKVFSVHRERHPELAEVQRLFRALRDDLEPHLAKEERILFPAIRELAGGAREFPFGAVDNPIRVMQQEHDDAGELLVQLRAVTNGYSTPDDGCASYHLLYERLAALELDTHLHIHKETYRLFPVAIELQQS